jgi:hypothetical protein
VKPLLYLVSAFLLTLGLVFILGVPNKAEQLAGITMMTMGIFGLRQNPK